MKPASILLIINSGKGKTGTQALAKLPNVTFVDCGKADEETIKKWIYLTTKKAGVYTDGVTCGLLAAYCNYDMSRVSMETEKLLTYLDIEAEKAGTLAIDIPFDRQELADFLEVERSGLSVEIGKLVKEGVIKNTKKHFELL